MKTVSIQEAEGQLGELFAEARRGETVVLTDGQFRMTLAPFISNPEEDSPELEAELLKAADGPFKPYREGALREIADRALAEYRAKPKK